MWTMHLMCLTSIPSPNATLTNINLSFDFPSTNYKTTPYRSWSGYWAWNWVNILFLAIAAAPIGSYWKGPNLLLKYTNTLQLLQGSHISVSMEKYCTFQLVHLLMDPILALIWGLLDLVLNNNNIIIIGLISTDTWSISPKECTISSAKLLKL